MQPTWIIYLDDKNYWIDLIISNFEIDFLKNFVLCFRYSLGLLVSNISYIFKSYDFLK